jgi:hypothetical protein
MLNNYYSAHNTKIDQGIILRRQERKKIINILHFCTPRVVVGMYKL